MALGKVVVILAAITPPKAISVRLFGSGASGKSSQRGFNSPNMRLNATLVAAT